MKNFMDQDFLLSNDTAKTLYHDYASKMPIIDYHCHINPKEIAENKEFKNITEVWLGGDHYKWRAMRSNATDEKFVTGDATDREKFQKWAETLTKAIGNPLFHWTHLELQKYFDYHGVLNGDTAEEVWNLCNEKLTSGSMHVRDIIEASNVKLICTTDDPIDSLEYHLAIKNDPTCKVKVLPAWRPDKAVNIDKGGFVDYIAALSKASSLPISNLKELFAAIDNRLDFFHEMGCKAADHGLDYVPYNSATLEEVEAIFQKALKGDEVSFDEAEKYKTALLLFCGEGYAKRGWVMQLHYGAIRNNNGAMFEKLGPDTGFDSINTRSCAEGTAAFLNALESKGQLPKTIIYSLNPNDNAAIGTILGCFQGTEATGKLQQGSAWWFNDTKQGMIDQMVSLANLSLLGNFVGMLTDSRSFLSYTRHDYFRRILCNLIGTWVENGEYPNDIPTLGQMVQDISYNNTVNYFGFTV
ncbi:glucuronate isomerase [Sporanaerobium hydrogeniformans]|uniref:Glucuronate isomerase n=1 Tax=Sporanaerobium hydrogeniformans TaxID=3072179 RepID=A0AC61DCC9_9FIRM|nr:glucuronate isomerase [Sporanaerobium hydrogeniformans]PHV70969.1 glucuronate isomerase [Sporanaerobium hydrogeniformans]